MRPATTSSVTVDVSFIVKYVYWSPSKRVVCAGFVEDFGIVTHQSENYAGDMVNAITQHANPGTLVIPLDGITAYRLGFITKDTLANDYPELPIEIQAAIRMMI